MSIKTKIFNTTVIRFVDHDYKRYKDIFIIDQVFFRGEDYNFIFEISTDWRYILKSLFDESLFKIYNLREYIGDVVKNFRVTDDFYIISKHNSPENIIENLSCNYSNPIWKLKFDADTKDFELYHKCIEAILSEYSDCLKIKLTNENYDPKRIKNIESIKQFIDLFDNGDLFIEDPRHIRIKLNHITKNEIFNTNGTGKNNS